ncbi:hypothetical protein POVCU1_072570 [Plasmodium ovale curtisi]|uniref:Uncharacterized protein n=1 Tax=Plasmodium ovale curtisi TaxID=864141 RepID=A0A1A8X9Y8_PLAOA|nr:hypothetical protein POVCU1_072570 [Plasmodium ovale curtisi]
MVRKDKSEIRKEIKKKIKNNPKLCKKEKGTNIVNNPLSNITKNKNDLKSSLEIKKKKKEIVLENPKHEKRDI